MNDAHWCGKRIKDMSRDELEKAFFDLWGMYENQRQTAFDARKSAVEMMRAATKAKFG